MAARVEYRLQLNTTQYEPWTRPYNIALFYSISTPAYIETIRERYMGKWICGLCSEAVKDEVIKSKRLITTDEALNRHLNVCRMFRSSCPPAGGDPTAHLIKAMRSILRRSLDSPRVRSTPVSPNREGKFRPKLTRSESCYPSL
ncbi:uncharacterized protein LOC141631204 [Silene latifolia]|uniref:uncharacterized protein LOC141631204 n=1 Tax=Silene latifolia TaxID=37657 RepID=UPI003D782903